MRNALQLLRAILLAAAMVSPGGAQKFYPDDPLEREPAPLDVKQVLARKLSDYYDFFLNTFARPGRGAKPKPAGAVNTLGEPMDGAWYTRRHYYRRMSLEELRLGPDGRTPPSEGLWTVIRAKTEGITPGFTILDRDGRMYFLKLDPATNPEMSTAADVIGARFFYALGYHVPDNYIVYFTADRLAPGEDVTIQDKQGRRRKMTRRDLLEILLKAPRDRRGRYRAVASRALEGKPLGPFRYYGMRRDDPNDIVPHEDRRDLRGLRVFCAWLNHEDSRAVNTLDTLVKENGVQYIRHHLIDFGSTLGSASTKANPPRSGHEYMFDWKTATHHFLTLGLAVPKWARVDYPDLPSVGRFEASAFDPEKWVPEYPNPAFENCLPEDAYWAAKQVMSFTNEEIRAIVREGRYSDPAAEQYVGRVLAARRDKIGKAYLEKVLPLDRFRVTEGRLEFDDLGVKFGLVKQRPLEVKWARYFDGSGAAEIVEASGFAVPEWRGGGEGDWLWQAEIYQQGDAAQRQVRVYLRRDGKVVGVERTWLR